MVETWGHKGPTSDRTLYDQEREEQVKAYSDQQQEIVDKASKAARIATLMAENPDLSEEDAKARVDEEVQTAKEADQEAEKERRSAAGYPEEGEGSNGGG
jgi:uncharacterized membrane protein YukC